MSRQLYIGNHCVAARRRCLLWFLFATDNSCACACACACACSVCACVHALLYAHQHVPLYPLFGTRARALNKPEVAAAVRERLWHYYCYRAVASAIGHAVFRLSRCSGFCTSRFPACPALFGYPRTTRTCFAFTCSSPTCFCMRAKS